VWRAAWSEFIPFLDYDVEICRIICSTNAIESLNARYRRSVRARGHFPTEQARSQVPLPGQLDDGRIPAAPGGGEPSNRSVAAASVAAV
jgi:Transposase, Mutator family